MLNGKFVGSRHDISVAVLNGLVALPPQYRTIDGVIDEATDSVLDIGNMLYKYMPGHRMDLSVGCNMGLLRDLGDSHATLYGTPFDGTISTDYTGASDFPVTLYGVDSDGMPVTLVINDKTLTPANPFHHIDRIHKEHSDVSVRVLHTAADTTVTNLAWLAPTIEESYYRRYVIDKYLDTASTTIVALASLRHIEFTSDQDIIPFTCISALESMLDSLQYRAENDITLADRYENDAVNLCNMELGEVNSNNSYPVIRFIYPGRTAPRLTSHY